MLVQPKKYGRYILLVIFVIFLINNPAQAADLVNNAVDWMNEAADALGVFGGRLDLE